MASLQCEKLTEQTQPQTNGESTKSSAAHKITEMATHVMRADQKNQEQSYKEVANHEQVVAHENQVVKCECKSHESVVVQDGKIKIATNEKKKKKKKKDNEKETKEANKDCHKVTYDTTDTVICKSVKADTKTKDEKKKEQKEKRKKKKNMDKDGKSSSSSSSSSSESEDDASNKKKGRKKYRRRR